MCFGKTKTLKSLREQCTNSNESDLGFNLDDEGITRKHKKGGGVGFLIKDRLIYKRRPDLSKNCQHDSYEHILIELKGSSYNTIIGSLYRPPNTDVEKFLDEYNDTLGSISSEKNKEVILGMDHNLDLLKQASHKMT